MSHTRSNFKRKRANDADGIQTLGMVWGANSASSSRNSLQNKGGAAFRDFSSYMSEKERKLGLQFQSEAENSLLNADTDSASGTGNASGAKNTHGLFSGISVFVDGFTIPSNQELRNYMIKYGGRFENYFSRERVTHIICSNLPDSKIKNIRTFSKGLPVVKPQWIVDCIAAKKVLNVGPYQLERLANECPQQRRLSSFFNVKHNSVSDMDIRNEIELVSTCSGQESSLNGGTSERNKDSDCKPQAGTLQENQTPLADAQNVIANAENCNEESLQILDSKYQIPCSSNLNFFDQTNHGDACSENEILKFDNPRSAKTEDISNPVDVACIEAMESRPSRTKHKSDLTMEDVNFVENYFKNSRLHFIGTWRNRYRKRYGGKSNEATQCQYSGFDATSSSTSLVDSRVIIHIDMDCFFVSVVIRKRPELDGKPVAVCHSDNPHGTAEISSANYPARGYGIRAGLFVRDAKALCSHLVIVPYDFSAYEEVADHFYEILHKHCNRVQVLSCDEAYLDVSGLHDPDLIASAIRQEIFDVTRCTASAGIAGNLLMARMATKRAKPNGQFHIQPEKVDQFLAYLPIRELPGVGPALQEKLNNQNIHNCSQLRKISKEALQRDYGSKTGDMLWHYSRGIDHRQVHTAQEHKSLGAEVNWGVRFNNSEDVYHFLTNLSKEVSLRLQGASMRGRTITLKVKKRKKGAGEPAKFMGCGSCDNISHSVTVPSATDNIDVLLRISQQIFESFHLDVREVRGIGLQVSRLEAADSCHQGPGKNVLKSWLASMAKMPNSCELVQMSNEANPVAGERVKVDETHSLGKGFQSAERYDAKVKVTGKIHEGGLLPHISQLDPTVLASLPPEILSEINDFYNGKVFNSISGIGKDFEKYNGPNMDASYSHSAGTGSTREELEASVFEGHSREDVESGFKNMDCDKSQKIELKETKGRAQVVAPMNCSLDVPAQSQLDRSVLLALPLSLRLEIEQHYNGTNALRKENGPVNLWRKKTSSESQCPISNPGKGITERIIGKASSSNSHTSDFMKKSIGNIERQKSKYDTISLSLSQVDISILQELPTDIQCHVLEYVPAHRSLEALCENAMSCKREVSNILDVENVEEPKNACLEADQEVDTNCEKCLWKGNPPDWVTFFRLSSCVLLQLISECYSKTDSTNLLSSLLQYLLSSLPQEFVSCRGIQKHSVVKCSDLFTDYIKEKVKYDIEEIYICVRLLKRLVVKSNFWLAVYNAILPSLQARVGEIYGGNLNV